MTNVVRSLDELLDVPDPAWPELEAAARGDGVRVLPVADEQGRDVLYRLQVTARSGLGALALHCGGILVDGGWLRLLGGGAPGMPDLATANGLGDPAEGRPQPGAMFVAVDVLGGRFAIDGGGLRVAMGKVCYFGPDTLGWQNLDIGHHDFVMGMLNGAASRFYEDLRWPGWQDEVAGVATGEGLALHPPPFTEQGKDVAAASRRPVPLGELFAFYDDAARQLAQNPD